MKKIGKETKGKTSKNKRFGTPAARDVLRRLKYYKITEPVTVKFQLPLAQFIRRHGGSRFIRRVIIEKLREENG